MSRPYRPANGRWELPQPYNEDFIPADPFGPRPTRTMSLPALSENRSTKITSRFNAETGEVVICLGFADPAAEKTAINQIITDAKKKAPLHRITLIIEGETARELSAYVFLTRNKFSRDLSREASLTGQLVWSKQLEEK